MKKLNGQPIEGADISQHQAEQDPPFGNRINFLDLKKAGVRFCYIKASEGETGQDRAFSEHARNASTEDIPLGAYHFFRVRRDPKKQALNLFRAVNALLPRIFKSFQMPPALDFEPLVRFKNGVKIDVDDIAGLKPGEYAARALVFAQEVERLFGVRPLVYAYPAFAIDQRLSETLGQYPLWLSHFVKNARNLIFPKGFNEVPIWQYSGSGKIKGAPTIIDRDRIYLDSWKESYPQLATLFS